MYTDFLDNPIQQGDEIVYAQSAYGGGAELHRARIKKLVALVPHRDGPFTRRDGSTREHFMREDQINNAHPTIFKGDIYNDPAKRYVVQIMKERWRSQRVGGPGPQKYTLPKSNSVIRVPA